MALTTQLRTRIGGLRGPGLSAEDTTAFEALVTQAETAADAAEAAVDQVPYLPAMPTNFRYDPDLPDQTEQSGQTLTFSTTTDPVFVERGYDRVIELNAGSQLLEVVFPTRPILPGEKIAFRRLVAIDDADEWAQTNGRFAVYLLRDGDNVGSALSVAFDTVTYHEVIDTTHRYIFQQIENTRDEPITSIYAYVNLTGKTVNLLAGGWVINAAPHETRGVTDADDDPWGVARLKQRLGLEGEVVGYGDSLMAWTGASSEAQGMAARVAHYLGTTSSILGIPGAYSGSIADRSISVPIKLANNRLDADGSTVIEEFNGAAIASAASGNHYGQPLSTAAANTTFAVECVVAGVLCTMTRTATGGPPSTLETYVLTYPVLPANISVAPTSATGAAAAVAAVFPRPPEGSIVLNWQGTNDRNLYASVIANGERVIAAHPNGRRLILGPLTLNSETKTSGAGNYTNARLVSKGLSASLGDLYIDTLSELIRWGLVSQGLTPTGGELTEIAEGVVPDRLRSDTLHLSDAGYDAVAQIVVCRIVELGWRQLSSLAYEPALWAIKHP